MWAPCWPGYWGWATLAVDLRLETSRLLYLEREGEAGCCQCLELELPALVNVRASPCQPRYSSRSNLLKAKATPCETVDATDLPASPFRQELLGMACPQRQRAGRVLSGSLEGQAAERRAILRRQGLL
ncbi:hypothetical protein DFAR_2590007 [Desulfarculales bacterium]